MKTFHYSNTQIITFSFLVILLGVFAIKFINIDFFRYKNAANINPQMLAILVKQGDDLSKSSDDVLAQSRVVLQHAIAQPKNDGLPQMTSLWEKTDYKTGIPKIPLNDRVVEYEMVMMSPQASTLPSVGQAFIMPLPNNSMVSAQVESVTLNPNGDYTWRGHLNGFGNQYPVTMTYGENQIYATVTSPQGSYSLETSFGLGWIYKNPAEPELSNTHFNDSALPKIFP